MKFRTFSNTFISLLKSFSYKIIKTILLLSVYYLYNIIDLILVLLYTQYSNKKPTIMTYFFNEGESLHFNNLYKLIRFMYV